MLLVNGFENIVHLYLPITEIGIHEAFMAIVDGHIGDSGRLEAFIEGIPFVFGYGDIFETAEIKAVIETF